MKAQTLFVFFWTMILFLSKLNAQWSRTSGPSGGMVLNLQSNDQYLFAGARNGVYRSADNGENWEQLTNGLPFSFICYDLNSQGDNVLIYGTDWIKKWSGVFRCEVYKSTDSGNEWKKIPLPDSIYYPTEIALHDTFIFVGDQALLRSMDDGATWTTLLTWPQDSFDYCRKIEIYDERLFVIGAHRAWISDDWGDHWEQIVFPSLCQGYDLFPLDSLMILTCQDAAYRSLDYGKTWTKSTGWREVIPDYKDIYFQNDTLYSNGRENVLRSFDFGQSWESVPPDTSHFWPNDLTIHQGQIYACSPINGVQRFWPQTDSLQILDYGIDATFVQSLAVHDHEIWAGVDDYGLFKYDIPTQTWDNKNYFPTPYGVILTNWCSDKLFVADLFGQVFRSGDQGQTWKRVFQSQFLDQATIVVNKNTIYVMAGYVDGISKSLDLGYSWTPAFPDFEHNFNKRPKFFMPHHGSFFMTSYDNQLYQSQDEGITWNENFTGIDFNGKYIRRLWSEGPYLVLEVYEKNDPGDDELQVYISPDNGISWSLLKEGLPLIGSFTDSYYFREVNFVFYSDTLLMSAYSQGIFYNTVQDPVWKPLMVEDVFPRFPTALAIDDNKVFVGIGGMGVWQMNTNSLVSNTTEIQPLMKTLHVLPNPTSEQISFQTDSDENEGLIYIVDLQGKVVLIKHIEDLESVSIPVQELPAGKYTVRLETRDNLYQGSFVKI